MNFDFMWGHPARWLALGMGSGLVRFAPGTVGTLWAWALFLLLSVFLNDATWLWLIGLGFFVGCWACSRTAHELCQMDPSCIVWDEIIAFWMILCMIARLILIWKSIFPISMLIKLPNGWFYIPGSIIARTRKIFKNFIPNWKTVSVRCQIAWKIYLRLFVAESWRLNLDLKE